jgi:hypothetical protein
MQDPGGNIIVAVGKEYHVPLIGIPYRFESRTQKPLAARWKDVRVGANPGEKQSLVIISFNDKHRRFGSQRVQPEASIGQERLGIYIV